MTDLAYQDPFPLAPDATTYRLVTRDHVSMTRFEGTDVLKVEPEALVRVAREAMRDAAFLLRTPHLEQVAAILKDPEASENDRRVALALLRNAEVSARGVLPFCQDTGTAVVFAKKGQAVWTGVRDEAYLSQGIYEIYQEDNLRYSQTVPLSMFEEKNSGNNLPAQIEIYATPGPTYQFLFLAKGGGSANKTFLFQETKALLNPASLSAFLLDKMRLLGTAACPPYHLAVVIGGTSAEATLKTVKLASAHYLDGLPTSGDLHGRAFRDPEMEATLMEGAAGLGIGAQFGGKYFALDARVIRLPRHGASCPVGIGVSCSAHRNVRARIDREGIWVEAMERDPGRFIPEAYRNADDTGAIRIDLNQPMERIVSELSRHPVTTRLSLTGTMVVARDLAHAKLKERIDRGEGLPGYVKEHPIYYAGPAKTPAGYASGSFGPTTAGRMDAYVDLFMSQGGSRVMIAKGNRSPAVTEACRKYGGFYLGSIGGPAAILAQENIKKVEVLEYPELGMEAVYRIEVVDFPAFILIDDKGNDFFARTRG
jgi:fumarate hydratase, class I